MREIVASVTQRGQVTIPAEVRRLLGTKAGGKVAFQIDGDEVRLAPAAFTLELAYGSVKPLAEPEDFETMTRTAMEERAEDVLDGMRNP